MRCGLAGSHSVGAAANGRPRADAHLPSGELSGALTESDGYARSDELVQSPPVQMSDAEPNTCAYVVPSAKRVGRTHGASIRDHTGPDVECYGDYR